MDSMFGVSMNTIMAVLLAVLAVAFLSVAYVALRNRVVFKMGVRNVPRRKAQTAIVTLGLMLSTLITAAAFTTGDSLDGSLTGIVYRQLGQVDSVISYQTRDGVADPDQVFVQDTFANELIRTFETNPDFDGFVPFISRRVPVLNESAGLSEPSVGVIGVDPARVGGLGGIRSTGGDMVDLASLASDEVLIAEGIAEEIGAKKGDRLTLFYDNRQHTFRVTEIVKSSILTGGVFFRDPADSDGGSSASERDGANRGGLAIPLARAQQLFGAQGKLDGILISFRGDERGGLSHEETAMAQLEQFVGDRPYEVQSVKSDLLKLAELIGNAFTSIFLVMGLFSIGAGVLLIFLIFSMLAAERKSEMGMARAIGMKRAHLIQMFVTEGMVYSVLAAAVGTVAGVAVAFVIIEALAWLFASEGFTPETHVHPRSLVVAYSLGMAITFLTVAFSSWRVSRLNIVRAIRDLPEPQLSKAGNRSLIFGVVLVVLGGFLVWLGTERNGLFFFLAGASFIPIGVSLMLRRLGVPPRAAFTLLSLVLLALWLSPVDFLTPIVGELNGDIEMFFLSGSMLVLASTLLIVFNAGILATVAAVVSRGSPRLVPALRTAIAYPLASRFRTGLTIAMFSFVTFAIVFMITINSNFISVFTTDEATAGWDIQVDLNNNNPIDDLRVALSRTKPEVAADIAAVGRVDSVDPGSSDIRYAGQAEWRQYVINGMDDEYMRETDMPLQFRASGYDSDEAVWRAVRAQPNLAVIDAFAIPSGGFNVGSDADFRLTTLVTDGESMEPVQVELRNRLTNRVERFTIIGVLDSTVSTAFGMYTNRALFSSLFPEAPTSSFFVKVREGADDVRIAQQIESTLIANGVQAKSLQQILKDQQEQAQGVLYLLQGFMGLGLLVGIAAMGVVTFRAIVERRQQIGMLRAIGYQRSTVALSFLVEAMLTAVLGVGAGLVLALILCYELFTSGEFGNTGDVPFTIPFGQLGVFVLIAFTASIAMAYFPSRAAASVNITDALRYE